MAGTATSFNVSSASSILGGPSQLSSLSISSKPFFLPMRSSSRTLLRLGFPRGGTKPATLDTRAVVYVPLFVNVGDEILVDTRTGQYMTRAEKN